MCVGCSNFGFSIFIIGVNFLDSIDLLRVFFMDKYGDEVSWWYGVICICDFGVIFNSCYFFGDELYVFDNNE